MFLNNLKCIIKSILYANFPNVSSINIFNLSKKPDTKQSLLLHPPTDIPFQIVFYMQSCLCRFLFSILKIVVMWCIVAMPWAHTVSHKHTHIYNHKHYPIIVYVNKKMWSTSMYGINISIYEKRSKTSRCIRSHNVL